MGGGGQLAYVHSGVWKEVLFPSNSLVGRTVDPCGRGLGDKGAAPGGPRTEDPRLWRVAPPLGAAGPGTGDGDGDGLGLDIVCL
jgi:hypothetical protein